jgi:hypothetical protein
MENKLNNDFLIISYNEEARSYKEYDCKISPYNFDIYLFTYKSDHKLISLSMEIH